MSNITSSAAGGGPEPNVSVFDDGDLVWVQDGDKKFPGEIKEENQDNTYDIRFNNHDHPHVAIDKITKFDLTVGDDVIVLNDDEDTFTDNNFKPGIISGINNTNHNYFITDKYDVKYADATSEKDVLLQNLAETAVNLDADLNLETKELMDKGLFSSKFFTGIVNEFNTIGSEALDDLVRELVQLDTPDKILEYILSPDKQVKTYTYAPRDLDWVFKRFLAGYYIKNKMKWSEITDIVKKDAVDRANLFIRLDNDTKKRKFPSLLDFYNYINDLVKNGLAQIPNGFNIQDIVDVFFSVSNQTFGLTFKTDYNGIDYTIVDSGYLASPTQTIDTEKINKHLYSFLYGNIEDNGPRYTTANKTIQWTFKIPIGSRVGKHVALGFKLVVLELQMNLETQQVNLVATYHEPFGLFQHGVYIGQTETNIEDNIEDKDITIIANGQGIFYIYDFKTVGEFPRAKIYGHFSNDSLKRGDRVGIELYDSQADFDAKTFLNNGEKASGVMSTLAGQKIGGTILVPDDIRLDDIDLKYLKKLREAKEKEEITKVDIFSRKKSQEGPVYRILSNLFDTNKIDTGDHEYNISEIFDISKITEANLMLTGLFNQNNAENLPPSSVTIECYVNKDKTIIDLCVLLFIPSSLQDKTMSTVDGVFTANYGQTGRDLKGKNIMSIMDDTRLISKSDSYMKIKNPNFTEQNNSDVADLYKDFLNTNLNGGLFFNNVERENYINILFYSLSQRLFGILIAQNFNINSFAFKSNAKYTFLNYEFDIQTKIFTIKTKLEILPFGIGFTTAIGNVLIDIIFDLTNFSQSKIVFTPFIDIPNGDYLLPSVTDITFDENNLVDSTIEFTPPTSAEQIISPNLLASMIEKLDNTPSKDDIGFNSKLDEWIRPQIADKLNEILQGKMSLSLTDIFSLQKTVTCLKEEKLNIYLLNYNTLNALVSLKENYTSNDLTKLWLNLDRDIHGIPIYFNDIKYNLHNSEIGNTDKELNSFYNFIANNYNDVNGNDINSNSLCQILLLISQGVGNAIIQGLGVLLNNMRFVSISNNLLGNIVKKQFGITGNSIVIRSEKGKGANTTTGYIVRPRLKLIITLYFLLYTDDTPFAIVEIKINIDIQLDKFNVEYKTIGIFKYYAEIKALYFGKFNYNNYFSPLPNGAGALSVYDGVNLTPVLTIQSDAWKNGKLARGALVIITDNREITGITGTTGTMVGGSKADTIIQVGGSKNFHTILTTELEPSRFTELPDFYTHIDTEIKNHETKISQIREERSSVKELEDAVKNGHYLRADNQLNSKSHEGIVLFVAPPFSTVIAPDKYYIYIGPISPENDNTVAISKQYGKILLFDKNLKTVSDPNMVSDKKYTVFIKSGQEKSRDWDQFVLKPHFDKNYSDPTQLPLQWQMIRFGSAYDNLKFSLTNNSLGQQGQGTASQIVTQVFADLMKDPIANDLSLTRGLFEDKQRVFKMEKMIYIQVLIYFKILFVLLKKYDSNLVGLGPEYDSVKRLLNKLYDDYDNFTQFNSKVSDEYKYDANDAFTNNAIDTELNTAPVSTILSPIIISMEPKTNASVFERINQTIDDPDLLTVYVLKASLLVLQNLSIVLQMYIIIIGRLPVETDDEMVSNYNPFELYPMFQKLVSVYNTLYPIYTTQDNKLQSNSYLAAKIDDNVKLNRVLEKITNVTIDNYLVALALRLGTSSSLMSRGGYMSRKNKQKQIHKHKHKFSKRIAILKSGTGKQTRHSKHYEKVERYTRKF